MDVSKELVQDLANKLLIELNEEEEKNTVKEFEIILKHMDLIDKIEGIKDVKPLAYPFVVKTCLREDEIKENRTHEEILTNCDDVLNGEIKVPKVVE